MVAVWRIHGVNQTASLRLVLRTPPCRSASDPFHKKTPMRYAATLALVCYSLFFVLPNYCLAQQKAYRIGPRDVLTLTIYAGGEKQYEGDLRVSDSGSVSVPFIGIVNGKDLTVPNLEARITKTLAKDYFVNPQVVIGIKEYHSLQYYLSGAVNSPGLYVTDSEATLMELIAKAGGLLPERGNVAYILRGSTKELKQGEDVQELLKHTKPKKVDLKKLLDQGDMSQNITLHSGDVVYIPLPKALRLAESKIYVDGEVKKPGIYDYQPGMTAMSACIMAGGFDRFAAPNRTRIIRKEGDKRVVIKIDLDDVREGKAPDIELKPGDRIHVPETWL